MRLFDRRCDSGCADRAWGHIGVRPGGQPVRDDQLSVGYALGSADDAGCVARSDRRSVVETMVLPIRVPRGVGSGAGGSGATARARAGGSVAARGILDRSADARRGLRRLPSATVDRSAFHIRQHRRVALARFVVGGGVRRGGPLVDGGDDGTVAGIVVQQGLSARGDAGFADGGGMAMASSRDVRACGAGERRRGYPAAVGSCGGRWGGGFDLGASTGMRRWGQAAASAGGDV